MVFRLFYRKFLTEERSERNGNNHKQKGYIRDYGPYRQKKIAKNNPRYFPFYKNQLFLKIEKCLIFLSQHETLFTD